MSHAAAYNQGILNSCSAYMSVGVNDIFFIHVEGI